MSDGVKCEAKNTSAHLDSQNATRKICELLEMARLDHAAWLVRRQEHQSADLLCQLVVLSQRSPLAPSQKLPMTVDAHILEDIPQAPGRHHEDFDTTVEHALLPLRGHPAHDRDEARLDDVVVHDWEVVRERSRSLCGGAGMSASTCGGTAAEVGT